MIHFSLEHCQDLFQNHMVRQRRDFQPGTCCVNVIAALLFHNNEAVANSMIPVMNRDKNPTFHFHNSIGLFPEATASSRISLR